MKSAFVISILFAIWAIQFAVELLLALRGDPGLEISAAISFAGATVLTIFYFRSGFICRRAKSMVIGDQ
jgi:hypothetical protein